MMIEQRWLRQVVDPLRWQFKIGTYISLARFMEDTILNFNTLHVYIYSTNARLTVLL